MTPTAAKTASTTAIATTRPRDLIPVTPFPCTSGDRALEVRFSSQSHVGTLMPLHEPGTAGSQSLTARRLLSGEQEGHGFPPPTRTSTVVTRMQTALELPGGVPHLPGMDQSNLILTLGGLVGPVQVKDFVT